MQTITPASIALQLKTVADYTSMLDAIAKWRDELPEAAHPELLELLPHEFEQLKAEAKTVQGHELKPGDQVFGIPVVVVTEDQLRAELAVLMAQLQRYLSPMANGPLPSAAVLRRVHQLRQLLGDSLWVA